MIRPSRSVDSAPLSGDRTYDEGTHRAPPDPPPLPDPELPDDPDPDPEIEEEEEEEEEKIPDIWRPKRLVTGVHVQTDRVAMISKATETERDTRRYVAFVFGFSSAFALEGSALLMSLLVLSSFARVSEVACLHRRVSHRRNAKNSSAVAPTTRRN